MKLPIFIADAFTARAFRGNPAAVCLLEDKLDEDVHQKIAKEMNLSETAFIRKLHPTDNFTQKNMNSTLTFVTLSGELKARRAEDGIILDLPLYPTQPKEFHEVKNLIKSAIGDTLVQDVCYSPDTQNLLVRLSDSYDRSFLETLKVNTANLTQVENTGKVKGLILTLKGEPAGQTQAFDFYSRYFAPWVGVAEDPVTGSAHTVLSSYWSQQLGKKNMHGLSQITFRPSPLRMSTAFRKRDCGQQRLHCSGLRAGLRPHRLERCLPRSLGVWDPDVEVARRLTSFLDESDSSPQC